MPRTLYRKVDDFVPIVGKVLSVYGCKYGDLTRQDIAVLRCPTTTRTRRHVEFDRWLILEKETYTKELRLELQLEKLRLQAGKVTTPSTLPT